MYRNVRTKTIPRRFFGIGVITFFHTGIFSIKWSRTLVNAAMSILDHYFASFTELMYYNVLSEVNSMLVHKAYKLRLYPTKEQATFINKTFSCTVLSLTIIRKKAITFQMEKEQGSILHDKIYEWKLLPSVSEAFDFAQPLEENWLLVSARTDKEEGYLRNEGTGKEKHFKPLIRMGKN